MIENVYVVTYPKVDGVTVVKSRSPRGHARFNKEFQTEEDVNFMQAGQSVMVAFAADPKLPRTELCRLVPLQVIEGGLK